MQKSFRKIFVLMVFLLVGVLLFSPFFVMTTKANTLGEGYMYLSRMQTDTATDITGMFTPSTAFDAAGTKELRILLPETQGAWCKDALSVTGNLTIAGVTTSPIDQGAWSVDAALPGTLVATCHQGGLGENDYIAITGITNLLANTSYGFKIDADTDVFRTGTTVGSNLISYQLIEDVKIETTTFGIALIASDQVTVTAIVEDVDTITCTVGSDVNLGTLFLGGAYVTGNHGLGASASGTLGYYWAVYGNGNGTEAGLYKSDVTTYLLSSENIAGTIDLIGGEGFGLVLSSASHGTVQANYLPNTPGQFGAVNTDASLILAHNTGAAAATYTVTLGARASTGAQAGTYTETLTYVCGGYVGTSTP